MSWTDENALQDYLNAVGAQIRWKAAKKPLLRELNDHISDQARDFQATGVEEQEALDRAIAEMGDPAEVGRELDALHRPQSSRLLLCSALIILCLSFFALAVNEEPYHVLRQLLSLGLSLGIMAVLWFSDYTLLFRRLWLLVLAFAAMAAAVPLLARLLNFTILPYLAPRRLFLYLPILLPPLYAGLLCRLRGRGTPAVALCGLLAPMCAALATLAPDYAVVLVCALSMLLTLTAAVGSGWFTGKKVPLLLCAWIPCLLLVLLLLLLHPEWVNRLLIYLHPDRDPLGYGYLPTVLRELIRQFPFLTAEGIPMDLIAWDYLNLSSDFLLIRLSAALGWVVLLAAAVLYLALFSVMLRRILRLHCVSGRLVALSVFWMEALQFLFHMLYLLGLSPFGTLSLPLFTYGPGFLAVNLTLLGLLLSVFRRDALARDGAPGPLFSLAVPPGGQFTLRLPFSGGRLHIGYERE